MQQLLAFLDIFFLKFTAEPLIDLIFCLGALYQVQPVVAGPFGILRSQDFDPVSVSYFIINRHQTSVDFCADHFISHCGMNTVRKVNGCGPSGQIFHIASGCKTKNRIGKQVQVAFQQTHKLFVVRHILLPLQNLTQPAEFFFFSADAAAIGCLFVFPVSGNTVFRRTVHFLCPDLDFKRLAVGPDQRGVQRLIHIGLRHGDIVFKTAGDRFVFLMDHT